MSCETRDLARFAGGLMLNIKSFTFNALSRSIEVNCRIQKSSAVLAVDKLYAAMRRRFRPQRCRRKGLRKKGALLLSSHKVLRENP